MIYLDEMYIKQINLNLSHYLQELLRLMHLDLDYYGYYVRYYQMIVMDCYRKDVYFSLIIW